NKWDEGKRLTLPQRDLRADQSPLFLFILGPQLHNTSTPVALMSPIRRICPIIPTRCARTRRRRISALQLEHTQSFGVPHKHAGQDLAFTDLLDLPVPNVLRLPER